jgi:hypothetical protein
MAPSSSCRCYKLALLLLCLLVSASPYAVHVLNRYNSQPSQSQTHSQTRLHCEPEQSPAATSSLFFSKKEFEEVGLSKKMIDVLASLAVEKPSKIQSLSYKEVYAQRNCIIAGDGMGFGDRMVDEKC